MLKLAYEYGAMQALSTFEKEAVVPTALKASRRAAAAAQVAKRLEAASKAGTPVSELAHLKGVQRWATRNSGEGQQFINQAVKDIKGGPMGSFLYKNPFALGGAATGAIAGGLGGAMNAEEGQGMTGFVSGALGGAALGGATGVFGAKSLLGKNYAPAARNARESMLANNLRQNAEAMRNKNVKALVNRANPKEINVKMPNGQNYNWTRQMPNTSGLTLGAGAAGLAGGLAAANMAGANDKPWYQRMNPFG
jgi:hypothetical protein